MPPLLVVELAFLAVCLVLLSAFAWFAARRRLITSWGATFECSLRGGRSLIAHGWMLGIGRYDGGALRVVPAVLVLAAPA